MPSAPASNASTPLTCPASAARPPRNERVNSAGAWAPENGFAYHNWWHLALLHLDRLEKPVWDAATGTLSGILRGPFERALLAHVLIPAAWTYDRGKVDGRTLRIKSPSNRIEFDVKSGGAHFELRFKRQ